MKIGIGCDPIGKELKDNLILFMRSMGHEIIDFGSDDPIYANTAFMVAEQVVSGQLDRGVLICGTGIGMAIAANKVKGAYAASINNIYQATRASLSNNANIITLGALVIGIKLAQSLVKEYLSLSFDETSPSATKVNRIIRYEEEN